MLKPQWSRLLATLGVLLAHAAAGAHSHCPDSGSCRDLKTEAEVMECLKACRLELSEESPVYPGNGHMQPLSENIRKYVMRHFRWNKFGKSNSTGGGGDLGHKREEFPAGPLEDFFPASSQAQEDSLEEGAEQGEGSHQGSMERQDGKRSYAMEHFRWGKPVGRKRRPIKVYPNGVQEESSESYPQEFRRDLSWETSDYPELGSPEEEKKNSEAAPSEEENPPEASKKDTNGYKIHHFRWNAPVPAPAQPKKKRYGGFMTSESSHTPLVTLFKNAIIKTAYKKGP